MLTELKDYLITHKSVCITDVVEHFDIPPETARALLEHWIRKGKVSQLDVVGECRAACDRPCSDRLEVYQWFDRETHSA